MSDLIERQKALDALKGKLDVSVKDTKAVVEYLDGVIERILQLPSAEPKWIPVSERLPVVDIPVLVTNGSEMWVCSLFESPDLQDGEYQWEDNYGHWQDFDA